ncbi:MAG TPA: putative peptidoglycan glycosyltransferase FtsW [Tepidisphaeraceae bacterium]|nr:putative peptidoglycan glycosyltransferase FtsW [Tepidisphaeraceae bacterium]
MTDSIYRLRHRDILCVCTLSLLCLGVLMVHSATMRVTHNTAWHWSAEGTKQLIFALVSLGVFFALGRMDYTRLATAGSSWRRSPITWLLIAAAAVCVLVLLPIPYLSMQVNGARRWLRLGPIQLQASELAKWATVLFLAYWLSNRPVDLNKFFRGFVPTLIPVGVLCLLVVIQDFGTAALIAVCALTMLIAGRARAWHLLIVIPPALVAGFWFVHHTPYRWRRMTAFIDPYASPDREGYHMIQSLLSFSTGGVTGKGLGNGIQKLGYLPEDTTDFIFAVICEELGLFGAIFTIAMYLGIVFVAWQIIRQKRDSFGCMLAFGVASMLSLQAVINIAVATVSVPTKGLSLPLVSAGGSGLVITAAALGLMYSVACRDPEEAAEWIDAPQFTTPSAPARAAA